MDSSILHAIVLGILQGFTEFLPISSSAHLLLLPWVLSWRPFGLTFDVVLHGGTLLALLIYFRHDWKVLTLDLFKAIRSRDFDSTPSLRLLAGLFLGTLPAAVVGVFFADTIEEKFRHPAVTVVTLILFGLLLLWADRAGSRERRLKSAKPLDGFKIGMAQALALIPGVSRSGITITAGLALGLSRTDSARFSFLLGTPIIALATGDRLMHLLRSGPIQPETSHVLVVGVIFSFISGFLCIKYFLRYLESATYLPFVVYRLLLALCILVFLVF